MITFRLAPGRGRRPTQGLCVTSSWLLFPSCPLAATFTMAAEWKNPVDADVILRASGGKELHAHKAILSFASSVFRDMFSIPQPPNGSSQIPIFDVGDPPEVLETFLQIIYPMVNPPIKDFKMLVSLFRLADKYDVTKILLDARNYYLPSLCSDPPPIYMYAIYSACGREKEAEAAARGVSFASLTSLTSSPLLHLMTVEHYQRLIVFMVARGRRMRKIIDAYQKATAPYICKTHSSHNKTIIAAIQTAFEADPYLRVVEVPGLVSAASAPVPLYSCTRCGFARGLQMYVEMLLKELVEMSETLPWR